MTRRRSMAGWIAFLLFAGFGCGLAVVGAREWVAQARRLAAARPIAATIVRSEVVGFRAADTDRRPLRDNGTSSYEAVVTFAYELDGREHRSDLWHPNAIVRSFASADGAAAALVDYPVGAVVVAHVDDREPDRAFLVAEPGAGPMVFVLVGGLLVPLAWFLSRLV